MDADSDGELAARSGDCNGMIRGGDEGALLDDDSDADGLADARDSVA